MERQRRRNRLIAYGRVDQIKPARVPAGPVRAHVEQLHALGAGYERIGQLAGVGHGVMMELIYGPRGDRKRVPPETILEVHAEALLRVTTEDVLEVLALVDSTGTVRRLQALVAIGWPETTLAHALGVGRGNFWHLLHGFRPRVTAQTRDAVDELFRERWDQVPRVAFTERARTIARLNGWAPPLAWDDIDNDEAPQGVANLGDTLTEIIDEVAVELAVDGERVQLRHADRCEAVRRLHAKRWSDAAIANQLGCSDRTVARIRHELSLPGHAIPDLQKRNVAA